MKYFTFLFLFCVSCETRSQNTPKLDFQSVPNTTIPTNIGPAVLQYRESKIEKGVNATIYDLLIQNNSGTTRYVLDGNYSNIQEDIDRIYLDSNKILIVKKIDLGMSLYALKNDRGIWELSNTTELYNNNIPRDHYCSFSYKFLGEGKICVTRVENKNGPMPSFGNLETTYLLITFDHKSQTFKKEAFTEPPKE